MGGGGLRWDTKYAYQTVGRKVANAIDPFVERLAFTGSFRRGSPDVGDLDITVVLRDGATADDLNTAFARVCVGGKLDLRGTQESDGMVPTGVGDDKIAVQVWFAKPETWGTYLLYTTGSHDYNIATRAIAKRHGLLLSQYGVFRRKSRKIIPDSGFSERAALRVIGLNWVHPSERTKEAAYRSQVYEIGTTPRVGGVSDNARGSPDTPPPGKPALLLIGSRGDGRFAP